MLPPKNHLRAAWVWAILTAAAFCSCYPLMYAFRASWQSHYPNLVDKLWANNGRFALVGALGTELAYEELGYAARVNDASHHLLAFDPYIKESRSLRQAAIDKVAFLSMGAIQFVVRDINWTWVITRFFCAVAWFILIYLIALRVTESVPVSIFCGAFVMEFSYILTLLFVYALEWHGGLGHIITHNLWSILSYGRTEGLIRLLRPGVTYAYLFLASYWLIKVVETFKWNWVVLSGVMGGALAYVHLDSWTVYLVGCGVFTAICWFKNRKIFWKLTASFFISGILSLPFFLLNYPPDHELVLRGVITSQMTPRFEWFSLIYLFAFLWGVKYFKRPIDLYLSSIAAAGVVMTNIGFVTGYVFEPSKWEYLGNIYLFLWAMAFVPARFKNKSSPWIAASVLLTIIAMLQGISYAAVHFPFQGIPRDYDAALTWLDRNTPADSEVLTVNPEVNMLIPAYTHNKVSLAFALPENSDYPLLANYKRLLGALELLGIQKDYFIQDCLMRKEEYDRRTIVATGLFRGEVEKSHLHPMMFSYTPKPYIDNVMSAAEGYPTELHPDYVWFGNFEKEYSRKRFPPRGQPWKEVYRNASVTLYQTVIPAQAGI